MNQSFALLKRNGKTTNNLDSDEKEKIEKVLNDQFCNLDVRTQAQGNACTTKTINFMVK